MKMRPRAARIKEAGGGSPGMDYLRVLEVLRWWERREVTGYRFQV